MTNSKSNRIDSIIRLACQNDGLDDIDCSDKVEVVAFLRDIANQYDISLDGITAEELAAMADNIF